MHLSLLMNTIDYIVFFLIGVFGFILLVAGIILVIMGFVKNNLGFKVGGAVAILKGILFLFLAFWGWIAYLME